MLADFFFLIGLVILIGFAGRLIRHRTAIPESLFLILFGIFIGPVTGLVPGAALEEFVPIVSVAAMVAILVESGVEFDISKIRSSVGTAALFTLIITLLTTILITLLLVYFFQWETGHAALLGLIASGTTTITAMALLRSIDVSNKIRRLVLLETIINDFTLILGTVLIVQFMKISDFSLENAASQLVYQVAGGVVIGIAGAYFWRYVLQEVNLRREINYASTIGFCFVLYYLVNLVNANPIIGIFAFSLLFGNYYKIFEFMKPEKGEKEGDFGIIMRSLRYVQKDFTFFAASFFFVLLGITFDVSLLSRIPLELVAAIIALILIARLVATNAIAIFDHEFADYYPIITIMIPRGYVAAVLAFVPAQEGIEIPLLKDIVVVLIMATTFISIAGTVFYGKMHKGKARKDGKKGGRGKREKPGMVF